MSYGAGSSRQVRKRAPRMTLGQASYLANFMLKNKGFAVRTTTTEDGARRKQEIWRRLATELNSLSGANKNVEGWKKAWLDLRRTSRLRVTKLLKNKGPGADMETCNISDLDRRVLEAIGIAIKIGDDNVMGCEDEEVAFVGVKESDESCDYAAENDDTTLNDYTDMDLDCDVKDDSILQLPQEPNFSAGKKCKRSLSCSDQSEGSNYSDGSDFKKEKSRKSTKKLKDKRKKSEAMIERVLNHLQEDYSNGLKAIADAIIKISENKPSQHFHSRPKRIIEPWFHYLKFDR